MTNIEKRIEDIEAMPNNNEADKKNQLFLNIKLKNFFANLLYIIYYRNFWKCL